MTQKDDVDNIAPDSLRHVINTQMSVIRSLRSENDFLRAKLRDVEQAIRGKGPITNKLREKGRGY